MWLLRRLFPNDTSYNIPIRLEFSFDLDTEIVVDILTDLFRRHAILRTKYRYDSSSSTLLQEIEGGDDLPIVSGGRIVESAVVDFVDEPFDLDAGPPIRVLIGATEDRSNSLILIVAHHIAIDGESCLILARELSERLIDASNNVTKAWSAAPPDYASYVMDTLAADSIASRELSVAYWINHLAHSTPTTLRPETSEAAIVESKPARKSIRLSPDETAELRTFAFRSRVSFYTLICASFASALWSLTAESDIVFGSLSSGRTRRKYHKTVGLFANALVMRCAVDSDLARTDFLQQVQSLTSTAYLHRHAPFVDVVRRLGARRRPGRNPLFDVMLAHHPEATEWGDSYPGVELVRDLRVPLRFELEVQTQIIANSLQITTRYRPEVLSGHEVAKLVTAFVAALRSYLDHPDGPIGG